MLRVAAACLLIASSVAFATLTISSPSDAVASSGGYAALSPVRVLDTRTGIGAPIGKIGPGDTINLTVTGSNGIPTTGVAAVAINVTAAAPDARTFITVHPTGQPTPTASNLNVQPNTNIANLVIATVGTNGQITLTNNTGNTHLLADITGWFPQSSAAQLSGRLHFSPVLDFEYVDFDAGIAGEITSVSSDIDFAVSPDGTEYLFGTEIFPGGDRSIEVTIRDLATGAPKTSFDFGDTLEATSLVYPSPSNTLYAGLVNGADIFGPSTIRIVQRDGTLVSEITDANSLAWGPDDNLVATGQTSPTTFAMAVFPPDTAGYIVTAFPNFDDLPTDITISPDGSTIAYTYLGDIWTVPFDGSTAPAKIIDSVTGEVNQSAFSPDGRFLAFGLENRFLGCGAIHVAPLGLDATLVINDANEALTRVRLEGEGFLTCSHGMFWTE